MGLFARARRRTQWRNHTGNQGIDPLAVFKPTTLGELVAIVKRAQDEGTTVRAVGSGHSWSDVALTPGFLVETHGLDAVPDGEPALLRDDVDGSTLVWMEAGVRLRALNELLHKRGLALSNMGGYDAQTVAGVLGTSTHGSGIAFGPIADSVRSLDLVISDGQVIRVEPTDGPTDAAAFRAAHPDREIEQKDDTFHAAVVGMGCLGLVYGVTLAVEPAYCLKEVRTITTWDVVRADLIDGEVLRKHRHYELLVNPYLREGHHTCLITTRDLVECNRPGATHRRSWIVELMSEFPLTSRIINLVLGLWPRLAPRLIDVQMNAIKRGDYENVSYRVLNIGNANLLHAYSAEIGVPVAGDVHVRAVEKVFEIADQHRRLGDVYHSSAFALRFVRASPAFMSMMNGRETMMIELILLTHTEGGLELLAAHEEALYELGGRPHWGQVNTMTGSHGLVQSMYPHYDEWIAVHERFNASGVFDSPFSKRVGISTSHFEPNGG